ncbi:hypothetical protein QFZ75_008112 [Streptomyces sp. V3I8]|uniref:hypothetical protein n=1 Tax=Streptomyces sp. V3I8 TaxID=3042279 RepID=UPI0027870927|nr:hypothetical protein [Streptomyces sp. V3I8]MDQ1041610.1 hypothetical protein [Streptomyces sp. V3I8]
MARLRWAHIVERAAGIVSGYGDVGGCTLRQAYHQLVAEGLLPHTPPACRHLSAQLTGWLERTGIPVLIVRGFGSQSYVQVVRERTAGDLRPAVLLSVGDFDASGADIERDRVTRTDCWSRVERILFTYEQVRAYDLPAVEGKAGDPRWPGFARRYGFDERRPVQWEMEALDPAELQRLVLAAVAPYVDEAVLADRITEEERQRRRLEAFVDQWHPGAGRS